MSSHDQWQNIWHTQMFLDNLRYVAKCDHDAYRKFEIHVSTYRFVPPAPSPKAKKGCNPAFPVH